MTAALGPILVATDFSEHARHAATRAARLAHDSHSALTLLHVRPARPAASLGEWLGAARAPVRPMIDRVERQLCQLASELAGDRHVAFGIEAATGSVLTGILRAAESVDAGLLVLGARGGGVLRRLLLGSTSQRLMRRTNRPLLVVRQPAQEPYRRVLVAVDFSAQSHDALLLAQRVAPGAKLVILTVFQLAFEGRLRFAGVDETTISIYRQRARAEARRQLPALAQAAGLSLPQWEPCVVEGRAERRIVEQVRLRDCDLVVMAPSDRSRAADLLLASVTRHVLAESHVDVLVSRAAPSGALVHSAPPPAGAVNGEPASAACLASSSRPAICGASR